MLRLLILIISSYLLLACSVENQQVVSIAPTLTPKLLSSPTKMPPLTSTPTLAPSPTKTKPPTTTPSMTPSPTKQVSPTSITVTPTLYVQKGSDISLPNHGCLAFIAAYGKPSKKTVEPFLFNPTDWSLHSLQAGSQSSVTVKQFLTWSPTEAHLAMVTDHLTSKSISIWNIDTLTKIKHSRTEVFGWSANGKYIVTQLRHQWGFGGFGIYSGDGSQFVFQARTYPNGGGGYRALGWEDNRLLAHYYGGNESSHKGPKGLWLVDPATKEWTLVEELSWNEFSQPRSSFKQYGSHDTSSDGVLRASFKDGQLLIEDLSVGEIYAIKVPADPFYLSNKTWSPTLTCPIKKEQTN